MFAGRYRGKQVHQGDLDAVLARAEAAGVRRLVITGDDLPNARRAIEIARRYGQFCTVGVHPCQVNAFDRDGADGYMDELAQLIEAHRGGKHGRGPVVAVGECGLDYDRLQHATKEAQLRHFPPQLELARRFDLPLFLHARTSPAHADLVRILSDRGPRWRGVVHSFDGSIEEAQALLDLGLDLGINGCSLKTEANLDVVRQLPLDRLHCEADAPWCTIGSTSAAHALLPKTVSAYSPAAVKKERFELGKAVKGRNEPAATGLVALVIATLKNSSLDEVARVTTANSVQLFGLPAADS